MQRWNDKLLIQLGDEVMSSQMKVLAGRTVSSGELMGILGRCPVKSLCILPQS